VEQGVLTIRGTTEAAEPPKDRHYLLREHFTGQFTRSLKLPANYAPDPTEAGYQHGVLRLVFPKVEEAKARRIQVSTGSLNALGDGTTAN
jgi:HSP20 family protein